MAVRGVPVELGDREWVLAGLNVGQLRETKEDRKTAFGAADIDDEDRMAAVCRIVLASLSRNYPEVTLAEVEGIVDTGNFAAALQAIMTGSGLKPTLSGEEVAARIGASSTGSSPKPTDTGPATSPS